MKLRSRAEGGGFPNRRSYGTQVPVVAGGFVRSKGENSYDQTQGLSPTSISALRNPLAVPASVAIQNAGTHERAANYAAELELRLEELRTAQQALQHASRNPSNDAPTQ